LQCVFRQKWLLKQPAARKNPLLHESAGTVYEALVYQTDGILCQKKPTIARQLRLTGFRYASDEFTRICAGSTVSATTTATPEPATLALLGFGLCGIGALRKKLRLV
jgi:hypothetical protein